MAVLFLGRQLLLSIESTNVGLHFLQKRGSSTQSLPEKLGIMQRRFDLQSSTRHDRKILFEGGYRYEPYKHVATPVIFTQARPEHIGLEGSLEGQSS